MRVLQVVCFSLALTLMCVFSITASDMTWFVEDSSEEDTKNIADSYDDSRGRIAPVFDIHMEEASYENKLILPEEQTTSTMNPGQPVPEIQTDLDLRSIHQNLTDLLKTSEKSALLQSFAALRCPCETNETVEGQMLEMENNYRLLQSYATSYKSIEKRLKNVHATLQSLLFQNHNISEPTGKAEESNVLRECGGFLRSDNGSIVYKLDETLNPYEGCVWMISSQKPESSHLRFSLKALGFVQHLKSFLSVGYIGDTLYPGGLDFVWRKFGKALEIQVPSPVAYIHLVTSPVRPENSETNKGFELSFKSLEEMRMCPSCTYNSIYAQLTTSNGTYRHLGFGQYLGKDRATFLIQPTVRNSRVKINWWEVEKDSPISTINVWTFDKYHVWTRVAQLRESSYDEFTFELGGPRNHPLIIGLRSDKSGAYNGFEFEWFTS